MLLKLYGEVNIKIYRPEKDVIGEYNAEFNYSDQQDSHEFFTFLLDWVHNDIKKVFVFVY